MFSTHEQRGSVCKGSTHLPEPNTKLQTVKCFLFILDSCKMEQQHLIRQAREAGGPFPEVGGRPTNQSGPGLPQCQACIKMPALAIPSAWMHTCSSTKGGNKNTAGPP